MADPDVRKRQNDDEEEDAPVRLRPLGAGDPADPRGLYSEQDRLRRLQPIASTAGEGERLQPIQSTTIQQPDSQNLLDRPRGSLMSFGSREDARRRGEDLTIPAGQPAVTPAPGSSGAARVELERLQDEKANPWGSPENHPGRLGKIGHVLGRVGNIAGDIVAPGTMQLIPGTDLNRQAQERGATEQLGKAETQERANTEAKSKETLEGAQASEANARAENLKNPPEEWVVVPNVQGPNGEAVEQEKKSGQMRYADAGTVRPKPTQEQNKLDFQDIVSKVDKAGLPTGPAQLDKSLDQALKNGAITQAEHSKAKSYQSANPTPGTNLTVHLAGAEGTQDIKDRRTKALVDDGNGGTKMSTVAEAKSSGADYVPLKDEQSVITTGHLYNQIRRSVDRLAEPRLLKIFDDPDARAIVATATSDHEAQQFGAVIPGIGGLMIPVPGGTGKFIDSVLQNYKGANKAELQEYLANFWEAREASMNMMRLQTEGKAGARSQLQMSAVVQQLPGGATPNSKMAALQLRNMFANLDDYGRGVPDKLPGYEKYKAKDWSKEPAAGGEEEPTRPPNVPKEAVFDKGSRQWRLPKP